MSLQTEKPPKIGTEITVRISLTFQDAPDVHTLLAMTPVRERGKLVRLALERYIAETAHPAGNVEQQIDVISKWLRSRNAREESPAHAERSFESKSLARANSTSVNQVHDPRPQITAQADFTSEEILGTSSSIARWLQT
jgi:hypothetical protein